MISFIISEASIMRQLNHKNIVIFKEIIETKSNIYLIMELIQGQTLTKYIKFINHQNTDKLIQEVVVSRVMQQIFQALEYLHFNNIVHRDLKPGIHNHQLRNQIYSYIIFKAPPTTIYPQSIPIHYKLVFIPYYIPLSFTKTNFCSREFLTTFFIF